MPETDTESLIRLCVQFYTCIHNGDGNNLQRNWNLLRVVKAEMNWTEWLKYSTLHNQLHKLVLERLQESRPGFDWDAHEQPSFLLPTLPPLDQKEDGLRGTNWFAECQHNHAKLSKTFTQHNPYIIALFNTVA